MEDLIFNNKSGTGSLELPFIEFIVVGGVGKYMCCIHYCR